MRVLPLLPMLCSLLATQVQALSFTEIAIASPYPLIQPPLTADIIPGGGQEIVVFGEQNNQRQLLIYQWQQDRFTLLHDLPLPRHYFGYDITAPHEGLQQRLFFLAATELAVLQVAPDNSVSVSQVAQVDTLIQEAQPAFIYRDRFLQPLDEAGATAALIAGFNDLWVILQPGTPHQRAQRVAIAPNVIMDNRGARYTPANVYLADVNQDQQRDLIWPRDGHLAVFHQTAVGADTHSPFAPPVTITLAPDINGTDWWYRRDSNGEGLDQSNLVYRKLERIHDINADGLPDLVVRYTKSQGVLERVNDYEIYYGIAPGSGSGTQFPTTPNTTIQAEGTLTDFQILDVDDDQRAEVMLSGFNIGLTQIIGALLSGSVDQQVYVFALDDAQQFGSKPRTKEEVQLKFSLSSGRSGSAVSLVADIDGDGRQDLVLSKGSKALHIYPGRAGTSLFAQRPIRLKAPLPEDGGQVRAADLNLDGRTDLVLHYGKLDDLALGQTLRVLLSRP